MGTQQARDLAEAAVSKARKAGASYAEARVQTTWEREFGLKNGEPQPSYFAQGFGVGIRVIANGALGFAATNDMSRTSVNEVALKAVKLAKASKGVLKRPVTFDSSKAAKVNWAAPETKRIEGADSAWLRGVLMEIEGWIAGGKAGVNLPGRLLYMAAELQERYFVNSDGAKVTGRDPRDIFIGTLTAMEGGTTAQTFKQQGDT